MTYFRIAFMFGLISSGVAADLDVHVLITKRLTKKTVTPVVYNLRGAVPGAASSGAEVTEFDRMVLYLEGRAGMPAPPETLTLEQRNGQFAPEIVIVPVGSTVRFPNWDPVFHNVFSLSHNQPFDLGYYSQGQSRAVRFTNPGVVQVYCHIHSSMYAAIVVTSSPWFGKPAPDGSFTFTGLPPGHYRLVAWHKVAGLHEVEADVAATGRTAVTIRVPIDLKVGKP